MSCNYCVCIYTAMRHRYNQTIIMSENLAILHVQVALSGNEAVLTLYRKGYYFCVACTVIIATRV